MDSIEYYNKYASKYFEDTVDLDMEEARKVFLDLLEQQEGDTILDLGCGSGRDSLAFYELGYDVTALDGSEEMCKLAEIHTGLDVLCMPYDEMDFEEVFDGVWACASLVHVPKDEIDQVLNRIELALKPGGALYLSVKKGKLEGFRGERFFSDYTEDELSRVLERNRRLEVLRIWETRDVRSSHPDTAWVNALIRKRKA